MHSVSVMEVLKQQYTSCMKVGTGRNLDLSREYHKKLFGPLFYSWWNCPLSMKGLKKTCAFLVFKYCKFGKDCVSLFLRLASDTKLKFVMISAATLSDCIAGTPCSQS